jgi:hypothetical protein
MLSVLLTSNGGQQEGWSKLPCNKQKTSRFTLPLIWKHGAEEDTRVQTAWLKNDGLGWQEHGEKTFGFFSLLLLFGLWGYWHCGHSWPIVPASGDIEDDCGETDGMLIGRGKRSSRRKPAPAPFFSITKYHITRFGVEPGPPRWEAGDYFIISIIWFVRLLALRPLLAYCASLGWEWRWLWRSRWKVGWQGKPKFSEKTCPSATFVHHKIPHDRTRVWTRATAVGRCGLL